MSAPRLFVDPSGPPVPGAARALVVLVGGYDGSGNFGDMLLAEAACGAVRALGDGVAPVLVLERAYAGEHADYVRDWPALREVPVWWLADAAGAEQALAAPERPLAAVHLFGGGYLNRDWGPRKLEAVRAVDAAAGRTAPIVACGVQVDPAWVAGLEGPDAAVLARIEWLGARDAASAALAGVPATVTGDASVGLLARHRGTDPAAALVDADRVNVHLGLHAWVTGEADRTAGFVAALVSGRRARPLIAYLDPRTDDRAAIAGLAQRAEGAAVAEPVLLRPWTLERAAPVLREAALTVSCSFHVALASLLLGVPAALVAATPYYGQKAAGLAADFGLPEAFVLDPATDPAVARRRLDAALAEPGLRQRVAAAGDALLARHDRAEAEVVRRLAGATIAALGAEADALGAAREDAERRVREREQALAILHGSLSWRVTRPLRAAAAGRRRGRD